MSYKTVKEIQVEFEKQFPFRSSALELNSWEFANGIMYRNEKTQHRWEGFLAAYSHLGLFKDDSQTKES